MDFREEELERTKIELQTEVRRLLNKPAKPDVLLGRHPVLKVKGNLHGITIWHGTRIEEHFGNWVNRIPQWKCRNNVRLLINGQLREIDHVLANEQLDLVLTVETKRVFNNQDAGAKRELLDTHANYIRNQKQILAAAGLPNAKFRHFLFDAYGDSKGGRKALPVIAGDKIGNIFGTCLWSYMEWEKAIIRSSILGAIDLPVEWPDKPPMLEKSEQCMCTTDDILDTIDRHANVQRRR